jgi:hypothetical protein
MQQLKGNVPNRLFKQRKSPSADEPLIQRTSLNQLRRICGIQKAQRGRAYLLNNNLNGAVSVVAKNYFINSQFPNFCKLGVQGYHHP